MLDRVQRYSKPTCAPVASTDLVSREMHVLYAHAYDEVLKVVFPRVALSMSFCKLNLRVTPDVL